jgi:hypothetical protein
VGKGDKRSGRRSGDLLEIYVGYKELSLKKDVHVWYVILMEDG